MTGPRTFSCSAREGAVAQSLIRLLKTSSPPSSWGQTRNSEWVYLDADRRTAPFTRKRN